MMRWGGYGSPVEGQTRAKSTLTNTQIASVWDSIVIIRKTSRPVANAANPIMAYLFGFATNSFATA